MNAMENLKMARETAGLTQQQLSEAYGIPLYTIQDWDSGLNTPPAYYIAMLLRCMAWDYQPVYSKPVEPTYEFYDRWGKPLSPEFADFARTEYLAGRVTEQVEYQRSYYDDSDIPVKSKRGRLFLCQEVDLERDIPLGFEFRVKVV